jgi:hypothetical protein
MWHKCPGFRKGHPGYLLLQENSMKCPICKHGETKNGSATVVLERNKTTLVFKQPIFVTAVVKNLLTKIFLLNFLVRLSKP